jgi:hypothetical protein
MCGQIAYDWNTIPRPRSFAGTEIPRSAEKRARPPTAISPASGRSSPAMHRSTVVLPQPDGPRIVNSVLSATSKDTPSTAATASPFFDPGKVFARFSTASIGSRS